MADTYSEDGWIVLRATGSVCCGAGLRTAQQGRVPPQGVTGVKASAGLAECVCAPGQQECKREALPLGFPIMSTVSATGRLQALTEIRMMVAKTFFMEPCTCFYGGRYGFSNL